MAGDLVIVLTTAPDAAADGIAVALVGERLAACVNVHRTMRSTYRWKGAIEREAERQLVIKTTAGTLPALEKRLKELHPYEVPEFVVLRPESASAAYAAWVAAETA